MFEPTSDGPQSFPIPSTRSTCLRCCVARSCRSLLFMTSTGTLRASFRSDEESFEPEARRREDGSWLLAGRMPADEMADVLGIFLPQTRDYETVAGLVIGALHHLPQTGEAVEVFGWRFEVVDMDGRRVDKVLASRAPLPSTPTS